MSEETENQVVTTEEAVQEEAVQGEVVDNTPPEPELGAFGLPVDEHVYVLDGKTKKEAIAAFESLGPTRSAYVQADGARFVLITREVFSVDGVKILEQIQ